MGGIPPATLTRYLRAEIGDREMQRSMEDTVESITTGRTANTYAQTPDAQDLVKQESVRIAAHDEIDLKTKEELTLRSAEQALNDFIKLASMQRSDIVSANSDANPHNFAFPVRAENMLDAMLSELNASFGGMNHFGGTHVLGDVVKQPDFFQLSGKTLIPGATDLDKDAQPFTGTGLLKIQVWNKEGHKEHAMVTINLSNPPSNITNMGELRGVISTQLQNAGVPAGDVTYTPEGSLQITSGDPNLGILLDTGKPSRVVAGTTPALGTDNYVGPNPLSITILDANTGGIINTISVDTSTFVTLDDMRVAVNAAVQPQLATFNVNFNGGVLNFDTGDDTRTLLVGSTIATPLVTQTGQTFVEHFKLSTLDYYLGNDEGSSVNAGNSAVEKILLGTLMCTMAPTNANPDNEWLGKAHDLIADGLAEVSNGIYTQILNEQNNVKRSKDQAEKNHDLASEVVDDLRGTQLYKALTDLKLKQVHIQATRLIQNQTDQMTKEFIRNKAAAAA